MFRGSLLCALTQDLIISLFSRWHVLTLHDADNTGKLLASQALDNMLEDKNISRPLYLVAHGFITGQYAVTWALAHKQAVAKLVIMDVPLSPEVKLRQHMTRP